MTKLGFAFLFFVDILYSANAYAAEQACDAATLEVIANYVNVKDFYLHDFETNVGVIVSAACKTALQDQNINLVVVAYNLVDKKLSQMSVSEEPDADHEKEMIVAMVDNTSKHVLSSYQSTIYEDAVIEVY